jgi:hypothetical protein
MPARTLAFPAPGCGLPAGDATTATRAAGAVPPGTLARQCPCHPAPRSIAAYDVTGVCTHAMGHGCLRSCPPPLAPSPALCRSLSLWAAEAAEVHCLAAQNHRWCPECCRRRCAVCSQLWLSISPCSVSPLRALLLSGALPLCSQPCNTLLPRRHCLSARVERSFRSRAPAAPRFPLATAASALACPGLRSKAGGRRQLPDAPRPACRSVCPAASCCEACLWRCPRSAARSRACPGARAFLRPARLALRAGVCRPVSATSGG